MPASSSTGPAPGTWPAQPSDPPLPHQRFGIVPPPPPEELHLVAKARPNQKRRNQKKNWSAMEQETRIYSMLGCIRNMLRHGFYGTKPDEDGWVDMPTILGTKPLADMGASVEDILVVVGLSEGRIEVSEDRCWARCTRGHSLKHVKAPTVVASWLDLPDVIFHCTRHQTVKSILKYGIKGNSQSGFAFMSLTPMRRTTKRPVAMHVDVRALELLWPAGAMLEWAGSPETEVLVSRHDIPAACVTQEEG